MPYRGIHTFRSLLAYASVSDHGVARVCGDHRFLQSVLVLASIMNIIIFALFFRFCFEGTDNILFVHFPVYFSHALRKIRIQLHRGAGPKWQGEELAL